MTDDPWREFRVGAEVTPAEAVATDPWSVYKSPGLTTPRPPPPELRASPDDKYRGAAIKNLSGFEPNYTDRLGKGAGLGWTDELLAVGTTPVEMIRQGTLDPREGYRYAKANADLYNQKMMANTAGILGAGAEVLGGAGAASGVLGAGTQSAAKTLPGWLPGVGGRTIPAGAINYGANVAKASGMGAVLGAGEAPDIAGIPKGMIFGGLLGAGIGAAAPAVVAVGAPVMSALTQARRLRDPQNIAVEQIAEVARAAGVTPAEITRRVADANAAGQPYTVFDALGHEGARKLAAMAKVPGPQREAIVTALTERNLNMPVRTSEQVGAAMGAPNTARQAQETLYERAQAEARPHYQAAEAHPTWSSRLQEEFLDHPLAQQGLKKGVWLQSIENAGNAKKPLQDAMITGFDEAGNSIWSGVPNLRTIDTLKKGLDKMIEEQTTLGHVSAEGRAIIKFKNNMLNEIDSINPAYKEARAKFADPMQIRSAVERGQEMKSTGRAADNLQEFRDMRPGEQQGVRIGYADAVQKQLEQTGNFPALLREKSVKGARELEGMNLYQGPRRPGEPDPLRQYLNREEEMLKGSHKAIGGSSTAENLADVAAGPGGAEVLGLVGNVAAGNLSGAGGGLMSMLGRAAKGESTAQRVAITNALLARDKPTIEQLARQLEQHELRRRGVNPWTGTHRLRPGE